MTTTPEAVKGLPVIVGNPTPTLRADHNAVTTWLLAEIEEAVTNAAALPSTGNWDGRTRFQKDIDTLMVNEGGTWKPAIPAVGYMRVRDQQTAGTNGGTFTSGAWQTRVLQTTPTNTISGASVASNQITLPAGTYRIEGRAPANAVDRHALKLRNITDSTDTIIGPALASPIVGAAANETLAEVRGQFTISGTKVFELQHRCSTTFASTGLGLAGNFGVAEVFAEVEIWKLG